MLTAMGVIWGIFMLLVMIGAGKALENGVMYEFGKWNVRSLFVWTERTTVPWQGLQAGRFLNLRMDDMRAVKARVPGVESISPRLYLANDKIVRNNAEGAFSIRGETDAAIYIEPLELLEGRYINPIDLEQKRKVLVIGERVRDVLFGEDNPIGEYLEIKGVWFQVVGVINSLQTGEQSREDDESVFMPISTMQYTYNMIDEVDWFVCTVKPEADIEQVELEVEDVLKKRHRVAPDDTQAIGIFNLEEEFQQISGLFVGIRFIVFFVSLGTLIAGIIGVGNIMLIIVRERTREIGVRKALGATPNSIVGMIISESIILTLFSGYIGLLMGTGVITLADRIMTSMESDDMFFRNPEVDLGFAITAMICLVIAGAVAGAVPARIAANINPAVTLKDE